MPDDHIEWHRVEVRDSVHQFIRFDDLERRVIDTPEVQRLRSIRQLSLSHLVYPGATHTRFEHALGTMELAGRALEIALRESDQGYLQELGLDQPRQLQALRIVRLGALLHDVGHPPFSHGPEALFPELDGKPFDHERMTGMIIEERLSKIFGADALGNADPSAVADIAMGTKYREITNPVVRLLSDLVTGTLGVDRMDYLLRDSLHTGVRYGQFDLDRLLSTLRIARGREGPVWALEEGGTFIAEQMLMARWFMFLQVYCHRTRRILDYHLRCFLAEWLPGGKFSIALEDYLRLTDDEVLAAMRTSESPHAAAISSRKFLRWTREFEGSDFATPSEFRTFASGLVSDFPGTYADDFTVTFRKEGDAELWISGPDGLRSLDSTSELVATLKPRWIGRLYTPASQRDALNAVLTTKFGGGQ